MNVFDFIKMKQAKEKISLVTCYDYTMARLLAETEINGILVGDSVAMVMHGYRDTLAATLEMMCWHTSAVSRGAGQAKFIISDLPFLSYRKSLSKSVAAALALMQAGAHALKLENAQGNLKLVKHLTESGVPIMGHLGLTMQLMHNLGGLKVQGKTQDEAERMKQDALALQDAGCFALVLECVPHTLGHSITQLLNIPTIGIGAGVNTDGQILVAHDLLGMNKEFKPKFVKQFVDGSEVIKSGIDAFVAQVKVGEFPDHETSYHN